MPNDTAPYLAELREQLTRQYHAWDARNLTVVGTGLNFLVCR